MKKLVITLALVAGVATSYANNEAPKSDKHVEVKVVDNLKFKLAIPDLNDKGVVTIKNASGETIYREYLTESPAFVKVYNLAGFPDGAYHFEVKINGKTVTKEVNISTLNSRVASVN